MSSNLNCYLKSLNILSICISSNLPSAAQIFCEKNASLRRKEDTLFKSIPSLPALFVIVSSAITNSLFFFVFPVIIQKLKLKLIFLSSHKILRLPSLGAGGIGLLFWLPALTLWRSGRTLALAWVF